MNQAEIRVEHEAAAWFYDHFGAAAQTPIDFIASEGVAIAQNVVDEVGSGDSLILWGLLLETRRARVM